MTDAKAALYDRDWTRQPPALTPDYLTSRTRSPTRPLVRIASPGNDATGPIFNHEDLGPQDWDLLTNFAEPGGSAFGPRIFIHGRLFDENARPIPHALVECWQANSGGRYRHR
ncbi:MAG: protocatechuate 3,4-dioxygenase subunit beta, partial [Pseudomonadota bacterium]